MVQISAEQVKELRDETGLGFMDCKKALVETDGDKEKAKDLLRKKGLAFAEGKAGRATSEGLIDSYIHFNHRVGVLLELSCETDFVAKNELFRELHRNLCMHIAMAAPKYIGREEVPAELVAREQAILAELPKNQKLPERVRDQALQGQLEKNLFARDCLLDQPYIKDDKLSVGELIKAVIAKTGENIRVKRFARFALGEG
jgi:elongation factor Ts